MEGSLLSGSTEPLRGTAAGLHFKDVRSNEGTQTQKNTRSEILFKGGSRTSTENPPIEIKERSFSGGDWLESWRWQASGRRGHLDWSAGYTGECCAQVICWSPPRRPFPPCTFRLNVWTDWKQKVKRGGNAGLSRVAKRRPRWWHRCLGYEAKGTSADWNAGEI